MCDQFNELNYYARHVIPIRRQISGPNSFLKTCKNFPKLFMSRHLFAFCNKNTRNAHKKTLQKTFLIKKDYIEATYIYIHIYIYIYIYIARGLFTPLVYIACKYFYTVGCNELEFYSQRDDMKQLCFDKDEYVCVASKYCKRSYIIGPSF
jgi:hypothetical protein